MPHTSKFSVNAQPTLENQNPNGYSNRAAFFLPETVAAANQATLKKKTLSPLADATQTFEYPTRTFYNMEYGLATPQTPLNNITDYTFHNGQHHAYIPTDQGFLADSYHHSQSSNSSSRANILFTAPTASYQPHAHHLAHAAPESSYHYPQSSNSSSRANILFSAPTASYQPPAHHSAHAAPESSQGNVQHASEVPSLSTDYMDLHSDAPDAFHSDLSPLILQRHPALPPTFSDQGEANDRFGRQELPAKKRKQRRSKMDTILSVQDTLQEASLTPTLLLINILEAEQNRSAHVRLGEAFYRSTNVKNIHRLLDLIMANDKGAATLKEWMQPHAVELVCESIHVEMEAAKPFLHMNTTETTPDFIETWDINEVMDPISKNIMPTWTAVLTAAIESKASRLKAKDTHKSSPCRYTTQNMISAQVHYRRSFNSSKMQIGLGLFAWSTGASRSLINVLHKAGLSSSYTSINNTIVSLHRYSLERATLISRMPHALTYDNVNFSTTKHVEQCPGAMSKVQSGTFPVIYQLENVDPQHTKLAPIIANLKKSLPLNIADLRASRQSAKAYMHQTTVNISKILFKHVTGFDDIAANPRLHHQLRRPRPKGQRTFFFPLSVSTIEEASITGNILVHDNIYIEQLHHDPKNLNDYAIPSLNDQLTNARIRSAQSLRAKDVNSWERREIFQLAFGTFHLLMNLIWALLHTHRGTAAEHGSLTHYFSIIEKVRLGIDRPDFHTLLGALTQILEGLILNAWHSECEFPSLEAFAASNPSPDVILRIARQIIDKYATPGAYVQKSEVPTRKRKASEATEPDEAAAPPCVDNVHSNTVLLTRDLLYVIELVNAVSTGDFGRIEDVLPQIACIFRGAGSNNYSMEVLHFLFNIKHVWTPEFADVMRDIMLVNPSGLDGHSLAIDMNIEHMIGYLKALFSAKGLYSNWDRLANISATVNYLQLIKKRVSKSLASGYQSSTHKTPDTSPLVRRIAHRARELKLQQHVEDRDIQSKQVPDLRRVGYEKFEKTSLAIFNKKIQDYKSGLEIDSGEVDELPTPDFEVTFEGEDDDSVESE